MSTQNRKRKAKTGKKYEYFVDGKTPLEVTIFAGHKKNKYTFLDEKHDLFITLLNCMKQ